MPTRKQYHGGGPWKVGHHDAANVLGWGCLSVLAALSSHVAFCFLKTRSYPSFGHAHTHTHFLIVAFNILFVILFTYRVQRFLQPQ